MVKETPKKAKMTLQIEGNSVSLDIEGNGLDLTTALVMSMQKSETFAALIQMACEAHEEFDKRKAKN